MGDLRSDSLSTLEVPSDLTASNYRDPSYVGSDGNEEIFTTTPSYIPALTIFGGKVVHKVNITRAGKNCCW